MLFLHRLNIGWLRVRPDNIIKKISFHSPISKFWADYCRPTAARPFRFSYEREAPSSAPWMCLTLVITKQKFEINIIFISDFIFNFSLVSFSSPFYFFENPCRKSGSFPKSKSIQVQVKCNFIIWCHADFSIASAYSKYSLIHSRSGCCCFFSFLYSISLKSPINLHMTLHCTWILTWLSIRWDFKGKKLPISRTLSEFSKAQK